MHMFGACNLHATCMQLYLHAARAREKTVVVSAAVASVCVVNDVCTCTFYQMSSIMSRLVAVLCAVLLPCAVYAMPVVANLKTLG